MENATYQKPVAARPPISLSSARMSSDCPQGLGGLLKLGGAGLSGPLWLEIENIRGNRAVERVLDTEAFVLLTHQEVPAVKTARVRVEREGVCSEWVKVEEGSREESHESWPELRAGACYVPAGTYYLANDDSSHHLSRGFQLAIHPLTNREMINFIEETDYSPEQPEDFLRHHRSDDIPEEFWRHPAIYVNARDAEACCQWMGGSLPSLELWERAAAGWSGRLFPWGDTFEFKRLNCREARRSWTTEVGAFPRGKGPYDHLDLAGNVWEWTSPTLEDPEHTIVKGGSWVNGRKCMESSYRALHRVELRTFYIGFRVAWELPAGWDCR